MNHTKIFTKNYFGYYTMSSIRFFAVFLFVITILFFPRSLNQTEDLGLLILTIQDDPRIESLERSVFMIGCPGFGYGTGFLLPGRKRSLVTAAHVADILYEAGFLFALQNKTGNVYSVKKVYYHPFVERNNDGVIILSPDSRLGEVSPLCPDLAILELSDWGPPISLPHYKLSNFNDFDKNLNASVGFYGFSSIKWLFSRYSIRPLAKLSLGRVKIPVNNGTVWPTDKFIYTNIRLDSGDSGGPLFGKNGDIIGIYACGWYPDKPGRRNPRFDSLFVKSNQLNEFFRQPNTNHTILPTAGQQ